jgi:hypothetical protein
MRLPTLLEKKNVKNAIDEPKIRPATRATPVADSGGFSLPAPVRRYFGCRRSRVN